MPNCQQLIQFFSKFSPCDVADALNKFQIPSGGFLPNLIQRSFNPDHKTSVGMAYTVTYAPIDDPRPAISTPYIDLVLEDSFVVVGLTTNAQLEFNPFTKISNALYGGLMSTRAKYLKANGTVVFGKIRDLDEHRALNYPVWSYGVGIAPPKDAVKLVAVNEAIEVLINDDYSKEANLAMGRVEKDGKWYEVINPGDLIIGDENGIARIPLANKDPEFLEKIIKYVPKRVTADELVAQDIKQGKEAKQSQKSRRANL